MNHAGYYPGGKMMTMKVLYEKGSLRILGAQIVGYEGWTSASTSWPPPCRWGGKVTDLTELDLAYAPPYSSAKDPVNMAGFMAENIEAWSSSSTGTRWQTCPGTVVSPCWMPAPPWSTAGLRPGVCEHPSGRAAPAAGEIDPQKPVYVMCQSGLRSYLACRILAQHGYDCYNFSGGYRFYASVMLDQLAAQSAYPCGVER